MGQITREDLMRWLKYDYEGVVIKGGEAVECGTVSKDTWLRILSKRPGDAIAYIDVILIHLDGREINLLMDRLCWTDIKAVVTKRYWLDRHEIDQKYLDEVIQETLSDF